MKDFEQFLFGTASSSQQVEGGNVYNQFLKLEQQSFFPKAGKAADFYNRYEEDILLAKQLGMNAMRIQIEWSRVMPLPGKIDADALEHYAKILQLMKSCGIEPIITLFHWTYPSWLGHNFSKPGLLKNFEEFVKIVTKRYKQYVKYWLVINEPEVFAFEIIHHGFSINIFSKIWKSFGVYFQMVQMHKRAFEIIHNIDSRAEVGIAKNVAYHEPFRPKNILDKFLVWVANFFGNELFVRIINKQLNFIGLNYYFYHNLKFSFIKLFERKNKVAIKSDMGDKTYPNGLYYLCKQFAKFNLPILITENGIANSGDDMRIRFIAEHLGAVVKAKQGKVNVFGYLYWSLTDTYEWKDGYDRKFGLVEVNFETGERRLRQSLNSIKIPK